MSYKALYRKYRPASFDEVVGQKHIVDTLQNAVRNNKLAHAYLFCGPRGTGKTSVAKLLAKTINCTGKVKPCGKCPNCVDIQESSHPDVIELDAATNNGVDEVRELVDKIKYAPMKGKYKVYIIDEVHMMTPNAFNALLKTLEEPPEYCVFILATTEPHKVLPTIVSRCQRFDFNKIPSALIENKLREICEKESIKCERNALRLIADISEGGMRDALSILDQCVAYAQNDITASDVSAIYGIETTEEKVALLGHIKNHDVEAVIEKVSSYGQKGVDLKRLIMDLINICKDTVVYHFSGKEELLQSLSREQAEELLQGFTSEELLTFIDYLMETYGRIRESVDASAYFEVCLLKMMDSVFPTIVEIKSSNTEEKEPERPVLEHVKEEKTAEKAEMKEPVKKPAVRAIKRISDDEYYEILTSASKAIKEKDQKHWNEITECLDEKYLAVVTLLRNGKIFADSEKDIIVVVDDRLEANTINEMANLELLEELCADKLGKKKNITAITKEQGSYLINMFRQRQATPKPAKQEEPENRMDMLFGKGNYEVREDQ